MGVGEAMSEHPVLGQLPDLSSLLQSRGAKLVGRDRFDCPECHRRRSGTYHGDAFFCHGCGWKGNSYMLAKELGQLPEQTPEEARQRQAARVAAKHSYALRKARRQKLYDDHRTLLGIYAGAHRALRRQHDDEPAWDALAFAHRQLPRARAELLVLENASFADRRRFQRETEETRQALIDRLIAAGGLTDPCGRFVELADPVLSQPAR